ALRVDGIEVDRLQHRAAKALEAAGQVVDAEPQQVAGVTAAGAAEQAAAAAPGLDSAAGRVAGADREVGPVHRRQQPGQVGRVVGEVGVHLQHECGAAGEGAAEAGDVGGPEAALAGPVQNLDPVRLPGGEAVGDLAGA